MHPLLKSHILFYSNGLAIQQGLPNNGHEKVNNGRKADILNLIQVTIFQNASSPKMHPLLKSHIFIGQVYYSHKKTRCYNFNSNLLIFS